MTDSSQPSSASSLSLRGRIWLSGSLMLGMLSALNYLLQPDQLAALALIPPWFWAIVGMLSLAPMIHRWNSPLVRGTLAFWCVFLVVFVEQSQTVWKVSSWPNADWQQNCQTGNCLRAITLNCGDGGIRSAREVAALEPDVIFLQESPQHENVERFAQKQFGEQAVVVHGWNASLIARGNLIEESVAEDGRYVLASVRLESGRIVRLVSLRLSAPAFRVDFWEPGFWSDHREVRESHRREIRELVAELNSDQSSLPTIIGGDFNAPPYDAALSPLATQMTEAFGNSGRGWGATGTNEWPLFRVDQIWGSQFDFQIGTCWSRRTTYSDHRMVIADLKLIEQ
ncbi:MAG: endonuclease/exonuclease/phosphatase family protein [Planctomycetaceae bacterium]|nr:endonuclease/exonuclease/phosphatase family protein [Planctomycetaceae bacterium]